MLSLNENIKEILREKNLTQKKVAEKLGISECSISRYLKGTRIPQEEDARKIADFLGVYPKEWFPYSNDDGTEGEAPAQEVLKPSRQSWEQLRTWPEAIKALSTTHTISVQDICQILHAPRSWVNRYILPHIDKIYLPDGKRAGKEVNTNWKEVAAIQLGKDMQDSTWCSKEDFDNLILGSILSVTKQTKLIPAELLVQDKKAFAAEYEQYTERIADLAKRINEDPLTPMEKYTELAELKKQQALCYRRQLSNEGRQIMRSNLPAVTNPDATKSIPVRLPSVPIEKWIFPEDIRDFAEIEENGHRYFFKNGYIRIVLSFIDTNGNSVRKNFYVADPEAMYHKLVEEYVLISEEVWQMYAIRLMSRR
ncbi:MAG: helix-turn-helix transcriptional regulator [Clostridiales bacterium]|nr:helix-turn-helix transcriptional regulator [Clostridiales bacterium]